MARKPSGSMGSTETEGAHATVSERAERDWTVASLLHGRRLMAGAQVGLSFFEGALEAAILTLFARLALRAVETDAATVFVPGLGERALSTAVVLLAVLISMRMSAALLNVFFSNRIQLKLIRAIRNDMLEVYSASSWSSQSRLDDGEVQQLIVTVPNGLSSQISGLILHLGQVAIMIAMLGYSMLTDARLTSVLLLVILLSTFVFKPLRKLIKRSAERLLVSQRGLASGVAQLVATRFELQTFGLAAAATTPVRDAVNLEAAQAERLGRLRGSVVPLYTTVTYFAVTLSIVILVNTDASNLERTGPILLVVLRSLSYGAAIQQAASSLANLRPSIDLLQSRIKDLRDGRIDWGDQEVPRLASFQLDNVTFTYPEAEHPALREVSLEIFRGWRVGVVGPSGSGKSTLARLILGLLKAQEGQVLVNGVALHQYNRASWSRQVGVVPQTAQVISASVAANIRFFREGISDDALWEALDIADLRDEITALPDGLETLIGPGHRALSGGQQQRLAIARAFVGRPTFVVMDEPTSSVDGRSESAISDAIARISKDVTVVIISHRHKILEGCDVLATVENGSITAVGRPDQLFESSPYLRSLLFNTDERPEGDL